MKEKVADGLVRSAEIFPPNEDVSRTVLVRATSVPTGIARRWLPEFTCRSVPPGPRRAGL